MMAYPAIHHVHQARKVGAFSAACRQGQAQRRQRRLQPMRQIGNVSTGALEIGRVLRQQRIELADQGPDFERLLGRYPVGCPGPDIGEGPAQAFEGTEAQPHLEQDGQQ